ncbi:hypothetical protein FRX31_014310 [Thalictrum thalictroides]|uniref:Uncharacterized protein n=1 Tax=Thalictrum thalictroides TaxID=46969 RepID=A0A7J6WFB9_THATH|nr:hypothetical protein FRX31_014310 [Thalictrum thalictroides]
MAESQSGDDVLSPVEDDVWKSFVTSIVSENYSQSGDDVLSPEDLAWVDSCLVKDPELSEDNCNAMKDALFDIISSEQVLNDDNTVVENDGMQRGVAMDFLMSEEREVRNDRGGGGVGVTEGDSVLGVAALSLGEENDELLASITEKAESEQYEGLRSDRSRFRKFCTKGKKAEVDPELSLVNDSESPFEDDLFKVWDLNASVDEEDELSVELEKVFKETPLQSEQLALNDSFSNLDIGALDDIISGLADMSLHPLSGS